MVIWQIVEPASMLLPTLLLPVCPAFPLPSLPAYPATACPTLLLPALPCYCLPYLLLPALPCHCLPYPAYCLPSLPPSCCSGGQSSGKQLDMAAVREAAEAAADAQKVTAEFRSPDP